MSTKPEMCKWYGKNKLKRIKIETYSFDCSMSYPVDVRYDEVAKMLYITDSDGTIHIIPRESIKKITIWQL